MANDTRDMNLLQGLVDRETGEVVTRNQFAIGQARGSDDKQEQEEEDDEEDEDTRSLGSCV